MAVLSRLRSDAGSKWNPNCGGEQIIEVLFSAQLVKRATV